MNTMNKILQGLTKFRIAPFSTVRAFSNKNATARVQYMPVSCALHAHVPLPVYSNGLHCFRPHAIQFVGPAVGTRFATSDSKENKDGRPPEKGEKRSPSKSGGKKTKKNDGSMPAPPYEDPPQSGSADKSKKGGKKPNKDKKKSDKIA